MKPSTLQLKKTAFAISNNYGINNEILVFDMNQQTLLTGSASSDMLLGKIPDLYPFCIELLDTFLQTSLPYSALQFVPILQKMRSLTLKEVRRLQAHSESKHILIKNDLLKIVLILWRPGDSSDIHGNPKDGCVFRVLNGSVEEARYSTSRKQNLLGKSIYHPGSLAYIDDSLGYHSVRNPYKSSAVSIHVYTPGNK